MTGTVKFFNTQKGYGFITCDDDHKDYFVHATGIAGEGAHKTLAQGQKVEFDVEPDEKTGKQRACNVK